MAVHPEYLWGWAFVTGYSSATVAESHGIPCADAMLQKELLDIYKFTGASDKLFFWRE